MTPLFRAKSVWITKKLLKDFPTWGALDCFACLGNLGLECNGFASLQEKGQTPPKGGYGWPQWTGPRRTAYMAWCKKQNLDPASDDANYGYLVVEMKGAEKAVVPAVAAASGLYNKVVAFEANFERAGVKNYASRYIYAQDAQQAWNDAKATGTPVEPVSPVGGGGDQPNPPLSPVTPPVAPTWLASVIAFLKRILAAIWHN